VAGLDAQATGLRNAFNAQSHGVRLILLVSPT
jgi:hypothetical protein